MSESIELPEKHPLRQAKWIWPGSYLYLNNCYADFRKDFALKRVPEKALFAITADQSYRLYINGHYVCRGPARGYQSHWPYDELDIKDFLKKGHNWIAIEAYNTGTGTFGYIHQACAGMLCAAEWDDFKFYSDESWMMRRNISRLKDAARYSVQLSYQEHVAASEHSRDWIYSEKMSDELEKDFTTYSRYSFIFGRSPYYTLEKRTIPMLRESLYAPKAVISKGIGNADSSYIKWSNIAFGFYEELENSKWEKFPESKYKNSDGFLEFELTPSGHKNFNAVLVDIGQHFIGTTEIELSGGNASAVLDINYTEGAKNLAPVLPRKEKNGCNIAMGNRIFLNGGKFHHEFYHPMGSRYITLIARGTEKRLKIKMRLRKYEYPFEMRGDFNSSDKVLNNIYSVCRHTQQICALDAYVDTPWREQAQWWGDARIQARNTFYIDGDSRLFKRGIRSIAGQCATEGLTSGHAPTSSHSCILPDFALTWILTVWDYYYQTGDISLFVEQFPRIQEVLDYFRQPKLLSKSGLVKHDRRLWYFGDWAPVFKGEIPAFLNMWHLYTLEKVIEMLKVAGMKKDAGEIKAEAAAKRKLAKKKFFDASKQLVYGGLDEKEKPIKEYSIHDQTIAIMLKLLPDCEKNMMKKLILPFIRMEKLDPAIALPSPFWISYVFDILTEKGYGEDVIKFIRKKWSPMISTGTTWEHYTWEPGENWSASHAWTAHPSSHFVNIISGIRQKAPGWKKITVEPNPVNGMKKAEVLIPSPKGDIVSKWEKKGNKINLSLLIPEGIEAEIVEKSGRKQTLSVSGKYSFALQGSDC
ncbi:MAG: hypothetical protein A2020_02325 [Lentisphaerae bacterium GWF2_45_14]|nr:MAG: hypothetical protein A2020_02325 [Lentisphaerae bacterium GWF2_45_14]